MAKSRNDAAAKGARETMKTSDLGPSVAPTLRGTLKAKGGAKNAGPDNAGTATARRGVLDVSGENPGARRVIDIVTQMPRSNAESGATQANGRIVRSMPSRLGSFAEGVSFSGAG